MKILLLLQNMNFLYLFNYKLLIDDYVLYYIKLFYTLSINFKFEPHFSNYFILIGIILYIIFLILIYNIFICIIILLITYILRFIIINYTNISIKFFNIIPVFLILCHLIGFFIYLFIAIYSCFSIQLLIYFTLALL